MPVTSTIAVSVLGPARLIPTPATVTQLEGTTLATTWRVRDSTGAVLAGYTITVASSDTNLATAGAVTVSGEAHNCTITLVANGSVTITGTVVGTSITGTISLTIQDRPPATLVPAPGSITQTEGTTAATTWTVLDDQGNGVNGQTVTVVSSDTGKVTVGAVSAANEVHSCTATMVAAGTATLTGTVVGTSVTATLPVTVNAPPVVPTPVALNASPSLINATAGTNQTLTFTPVDSEGNGVTGETVLVTSSNTAVCTVSPVTVSGADHSVTVTLVAAGSATVTGTIANRSISTNVSVTVTQPDPVDLQATPGSINQVVGTTVDTDWTPVDGQGTALTGHTVTVVSGDTAVATVGAVTVSGAVHSATVTCVAAGTTNITGTITSVSPTITKNIATTVIANAITPWREEDWSFYTDETHFESDPRNWYHGLSHAVTPTGFIRFITPGYAGLGKALQYNWKQVGGCSPGIAIRATLEFPGYAAAAAEIWIEVVARYSATFSTLASGPPNFCGDPPNEGHKFLLVPGAGSGPSPNRYDFETGYAGGNKWQLGVMGDSVFLADPGFSVYDGQWYIYRMHHKKSSTSTALDGFGKWYVVKPDGTVVKVAERLNVATGGWAGMNRLNICSTLNEGPDQAHVGMTLDFGRIRLYNADPGWGF